MGTVEKWEREWPRGGVRSLDAGWRQNTAELSPVEYAEARRFIDRLDDAVRAVADPGAPRPSSAAGARRGAPWPSWWYTCGPAA